MNDLIFVRTLNRYALMKTFRNLLISSNPLWLAAWLLSPLAAWAADPDLPYTSGSTGADGPLTFREIPTGRTAPGMAYDPVRQEVVLFGGHNSGNSLGDTWTWRGGDWVRLNPATSPIDRWSHKMVWDGARNEIVMFGGTRNTGRLNDTWTWNGTTWTQKTPASSPSAREEFCLAYDAARQRVVLFGGNNGAQETWLWDGVNWSQANPATRPQATGSSAMAYHAARQECVLFGNWGQTWIWDGTNWTQRNSLNTPAARNFPTLIQDGASNTLLLFSGGNRTDTWSWNGTDWTQLSPANTPPGRQYHAMVWDATRQRGVMFGGDEPGVDNYTADTWLWNGTNWEYWSGKSQTFDMSGRASGLWNFSTIDVPPGVTVSFKKNAANTPVRWLAQGEVTIRGRVDVSGGFGFANPANVQRPPAPGGPGGFDGGLGAIKRSQSGSNVGSPGQGPGGGLPGTAQSTNPTNLRDGQNGEYAPSAYGNVFIQPLIGGSGGGGGSSSDDWDGGNGGGGGGAILIASSRDITVNGSIAANGGDYQWSNASYGGRGSGGAILLRADRITGTGSLDAYGGHTSIQNGRIRLEAYFRSITGGSRPTSVNSVPSANADFNTIGTLAVTRIAGNNVAQPPGGNVLNPDVVFTAAGPITVEVTATGVPNGTPIRLRIATSSAVITPPPVNLANGSATFAGVTVPAGVGTVQAFAEFNVTQ